MNPRSLLSAYYVLATVVGISIVTLILVGVPLEFAHKIWPSVLPVHSQGWKVGSDINTYLGTAHGFIYMVFVVVAFALALRLRWPLFFTLVTLACGTVPLLSFWAEARAVRRATAEIEALETAAQV